MRFPPPSNAPAYAWRVWRSFSQYWRIQLPLRALRTINKYGGIFHIDNDDHSTGKMEHYLSLTTVFKYLDATPNSRCFVEGEQVLNSRHLILMGIIDGKLNSDGIYSSIKIMALCLQTSALLTGKPHEVSGLLELDTSEEIWKIITFMCSCKAGAEDASMFPQHF
ncbi:uncharacterized protein LOC123306939 [Coccinella septempunctata]|uniref:uncharacterized protein LOC123306939 n=1 Tax=Coccinella septempunctata TaxID=41139 RepID=UPI001D07233E|nr:uncharacterized protein LOC123306939 [Coccinella septempunctata]